MFCLALKDAGERFLVARGFLLHGSNQILDIKPPLSAVKLLVMVESECA